jgi:hypothetical protein
LLVSVRSHDVADAARSASDSSDEDTASRDAGDFHGPGSGDTGSSSCEDAASHTCGRGQPVAAPFWSRCIDIHAETRAGSGWLRLGLGLA